ncbi:MAG: aminotransferase DegT [Bacteroidetes bacterium GWE2_42_24]|nr:MAG: aminotransferase DegT [Bacteroidetes bacterium GWE2_42_24]OFY31193.1 MAG: aminotransferase DegT [Bacteroidetes bacterium GWF2_43_11]HCT86496.1 DegT/DnrJ/EryC1/StrS family aminotransferase [Candidatus Margulisiibacteriota bacterium]
MSYKIPLFDLNFDEKEGQAVAEAIKDNWISTGPRCKAFEDRFAMMLQVNHAISTSNCTVSLHLALKLIGVEPDDEVICPSLTFVATVNAIRYMDAIPVFADVTSYELPVIDPEDIRKKITPKTKAILVMHYGGFACDMDSIMNIANEFRLKVVEDACHGPLSEYKGKKLGTIGDIGCFSFFSNKNISTGEGGMLVTNSSELNDRCRLLRSHGMTSMSYERASGHSTTYDVIELGYNYRMDDIHAAIGLVQLDKIEADLVQRNMIREMYLKKLSSIDGILIPFKGYKEFLSNYIFPIVLKNSTFETRDKIREQLAEAGIQTSVHYPAVHRFSIYKKFYTELPITDYLVDNLITLPMYSKLTNEDVFFIVNTLNSILSNE